MGVEEMAASGYSKRKAQRESHRKAESAAVPVLRLDGLPKHLEGLSDGDLHGRLSELRLQARNMEAQRLQEIIAAFACGVFGLLVLILVGRMGGRLRNSQLGRSTLQVTYAPAAIRVDGAASSHGPLD